MIKNAKYIIALICTSIVVLRLIFPNLNFDLISLSLIAIASFALLISKDNKLFEQTRKIKLGSFELELKDLDKQVENVEQTNFPRSRRGLTGPAVADDYPTQILKLSIQVEAKLRQIFAKRFKGTKRIPILQIVKEMSNNQMIDRETQEILLKFFHIRNDAVHGHNLTVDKVEFLAFQDIGLRILKILEKIDSKDSSEGLQHYGIM